MNRWINPIAARLLSLAVLSQLAVSCAAAPAASPEAVPTSRLLFVTNRGRTDSSRPSGVFGDSHAALSFGACVVESVAAIDGDRSDGFLDFFVPIRGRRIQAVDEVDASGFWRELDEFVGAGDAGKVVLFVHGYSYGFARACRRVSVLQQRLSDDARVVLFSWPSRGNPLVYDSDRRDLERSVPQLAEVLRELTSRFGSERVALVAHSMGTGGSMEAIRRLHADLPPGALIENLVLLAPDYDPAAFARDLDELGSRIARVTLYVSDKDALLKLSSAVNRGERLGQGVQADTPIAGTETIDVSSLKRYHPTGHEYYRYHPVVASDLVELLAHDRPARERRATTAAGGESGYWRLLRADD